MIGVKENAAQNTLSSDKGSYTLTVDADKRITLVFMSSSYTQHTHTLIARAGETISYSPSLKFRNELVTVDVENFSGRAEESYHISTRPLGQITGYGDFNDIIKTQIGTSSNNELSSGYSVRGGNFDENLVYVNDIEVYRPFLVRSGQQEGLSFANPNMVQDINFSAGGFEARYGDKLSSVLDITYRKPLKFAGTASASFLGGNLQMEGISKNRLVAWNIGARYRTNVYVLKSLDTKGEYRPSNLDLQSFLTFDVNPKLRIEYLGNIANNRYQVIPANRQTTFGTATNALRFTVYFDGQELMKYTTFMSGISATYRPSQRTRLKLISSAYRTHEEELYTVQGEYYIDQVEADPGKETFGQVAFNRGIGSFLTNGRNYLTANVYTIEHKGSHRFNNDNELLWGAREQFEKIEDQLGEWRTVDSAGFIVPYSADQINLIDAYKTRITLPSMRSQAYVQYNYTHRFKNESNLKVAAGVRGNYWTVNEQLVVSPRITLAFQPNWKRNWLFKLSGGLYYQPPFYRELRDVTGNINKNVKAQRSIHTVFSSDYIFRMWNRPFKLIMAAYFKELTDVVPYEVDNVRIRYFANNNTRAYVAGSDIRINGEFVRGVESWANIGFLRTYEYSKDNIHYTYYNKDGELIDGTTFDAVKADSSRVDPGYIPRPTDQMITFGMFFQDYLPRLPELKFNLNLQFGSGLPFGPPTHLRWQQVLRMPPYRRVDAGFAYNVIKESRKMKSKNFFNNVKDMWIFLEVFNLLQVQNTVSYTWIQDVTGDRYAIPNYLTNRQLNLRMQIKF